MSSETENPLGPPPWMNAPPVERYPYEDTHDLRKGPDLHPALLGLLHEGPMTGGQLMAAASLLAKTARPTDADIDEAMRGNICRCGTYSQIRRAIHRAAVIKGAKA